MSDRDAAAERLTAALAKPLFEHVPKFCGHDNPGYDEEPDAQDWSIFPTTVDQLRIEEQIEHLLTGDFAVLHVGVGNSSLARRLAPKVSFVVGTTIHAEEIIVGARLALRNYAVFLKNKFGRDMDTTPPGFDVIVDNNPASFACCVFHFCRMLISYKELLNPGGMVVTAEPGLSFVVKSNPINWCLQWTDWEYIAEKLGMSATKLTEFVYAMKRDGERPNSKIAV